MYLSRENSFKAPSLRLSHHSNIRFPANALQKKGLRVKYNASFSLRLAPFPGFCSSWSLPAGVSDGLGPGGALAGMPTSLHTHLGPAPPCGGGGLRGPAHRSLRPRSHAPAFPSSPAPQGRREGAEWGVVGALGRLLRVPAEAVAAGAGRRQRRRRESRCRVSHPGSGRDPAAATAEM